MPAMTSASGIRIGDSLSGRKYSSVPFRNSSRLADRLREHLHRGAVAGVLGAPLLQELGPVVELVEEVAELVRDLREDALLVAERSAVSSQGACGGESTVTWKRVRISGGCRRASSVCWTFECA